MSRRGQGSAFEVRETLDEAVRNLAASPSPLRQRVRASGMVILDRLSPTDFASSEDRELFDRIQEAFAGASCTDAVDSPSAVTNQMSDATAEAIASDILDLRDTAMGRAIRHARIRRHAGSQRGGRR